MWGVWFVCLMWKMIFLVWYYESLDFYGILKMVMRNEGLRETGKSNSLKDVWLKNFTNAWKTLKCQKSAVFSMVFLIEKIDFSGKRMFLPANTSKFPTPDNHNHLHILPHQNPFRFSVIISSKSNFQSHLNNIAGSE